MQDAWRAYVELALGLTEASKKRATKVAKRLIGKGGATAEQLQALAEDLVRTSTANRDAMTKLVRYELDRALGVVGLATADEVADLTARVRDLEQQLRETEARVATPPPSALVDVAPPSQAPAPPSQAPAKKAVARKTVAKKAVATKVTAEPAEAGPSADVTGAPARKTPARKAAAKKAPPRKASSPGTRAS